MLGIRELKGNLELMFFFLFFLLGFEGEIGDFGEEEEVVEVEGLLIE